MAPRRWGKSVRAGRLNPPTPARVNRLSGRRCSPEQRAPHGQTPSLARRMRSWAAFFGSAPMFVDPHEPARRHSPERGTCDTLSGIQFTAAPVHRTRGDRAACREDTPSMKLMSLRSGLVGAALVASALLGAPAAAVAAPPSGSPGVDHVAVPAAETATAAQYWTADRMRAAVPADVLIADRVA